MHLRPAARQVAGQVPQESAQGLVRVRQRRHAPTATSRSTFHLKRPQPSLLAMLASGYTPIYPCHVPAAQMRTHPIGTGPFKFVEIKQNELIKLVKNPDYWKKGLPYLDGIEYTIIKNRATAVLAFVAGKVDMTFPTEMTAALDQGHQIAGQDRDLRDQADQRQHQSHHQSSTRRRSTISDLRKAMALSLDRKAFIDIILQGQGDQGGSLLPPPEGVWGLPPDMLKTIPGYGDVTKDREEARAIMTKLGYGADKPLKIKVSTRNLATYRDPAAVLIDQLKSIYIDAELDPVESSSWFAKVARKDYSVGLNLTGNGIDDPDQAFYENYACGSERNYTALLQQGPREAVRRAVAGDRHRQAQEAGLGNRQEAPGGRGAADHVPRPHRHLLEALCQEHDDHEQQHLQRLSLRGRLAGQVSASSGAPSRSRGEAGARLSPHTTGGHGGELSDQALLFDAPDAVRDLGAGLRDAAHGARQHRGHPVRCRRHDRPGRQGQAGQRTRVSTSRSSCNTRNGSAACCTAISAIPTCRRSRRWRRSCRASRSPPSWPGWRCCSAICIGVPLGVISAVKQNSWLDYVLAGGQPERAVDAGLLARPVDPDGVRAIFRHHSDLYRSAGGILERAVALQRAGGGGRLSLVGADHAADALVDAGSAAAGLHPHRAREGRLRARTSITTTRCAMRCCRSSP